MGIVHDIPSRLKRLDHGGGGGDNGGMNARLSSLEAATEHIKLDIGELRHDVRELRVDMRDLRTDARSDFRLIFGSMIAGGIGLAGLMAKGFGWIGT